VSNANSQNSTIPLTDRVPVPGRGQARKAEYGFGNGANRENSPASRWQVGSRKIKPTCAASRKATEAVSRYQRPFGPRVPMRESKSPQHSITPPLRFHRPPTPPSTPPLHHSITPFLHPPVPFGSQTRLSCKLFSLLQIRFFGSKTAFTQSLQGSFHGRKPPFSACILYPRWEGVFPNPCFNSAMNTKLCLNGTEDGPSSRCLLHPLREPLLRGGFSGDWPRSNPLRLRSASPVPLHPPEILSYFHLIPLNST
jgi:hypothetical protein